MKSLANRTGLIFDLFFCLIFMPLLMAFGPAHFWLGRWPVFFLTACGYMYGCYFLIVRLRVPKLIMAGKYRSIALIAAGLLMATWLLTLYPLPRENFITPAMSEYQTRTRNYNVAISLWFMFSVTVSYALTISFVRELYERRLQQTRIENQRQKAELAFFKAQISPHFLFNTLNSLYSLVIGTSAKAEDAFIKFTDIMKYTYLTIDNEYVALSEEITYIRNYIDLQMIRLDNHTTVEWDGDDVDNPSALFPPMILLTFVENAFKYGSSTTENCTIAISLTLSSGRLTFCTRNRVMRRRDEFSRDVPVGIENCRNRLANLFPGRHSLQTVESDGVYTVTLEIDLDKDE